MVVLTQAGRAEAARMLEADKVIEAAYARLMKETEAEILPALWRMEAACRGEDFAERLAAETRRLGSGG